MKKLLLGFAMLTFAFMAFGQKDLMSDFNGDFESGLDGLDTIWRFPEVGGAGDSWWGMTDDSYEGDSAIEVFWKLDADNVELVFDTWSGGVEVLPETVYIFRWAAYVLEGGAPNFAVTLGFFDADGAVAGESGGQFPVGDFYEEFEHTGTSPANAATMWIGFRLYGADGSRWPTADKTTIIDNVQLWENFNSTAVKDVSVKEMSFYPNPVENNLNIVSESAVKSVSIYNIAGQRVKEISGNVTTINVESLASGMYIVKMESELGSATQKMMKK